MKTILLLFTVLMLLAPAIPVSATASRGLELIATPAQIDTGEPIPDRAVEEWLNTEWLEPIMTEPETKIPSESNSHSKKVPKNPKSTNLSLAEDVSETEMMALASSMSLDDKKWPWGSGRDDMPALPTAPMMEGTWWQKRSYSTQSFRIQIEDVPDNLYIWAWIERDQDSYTRTLTFRFDGNIVNQRYIGKSGFKSCVQVPSSMIGPGSDHLVEISINFCGWKLHQWKLRYVWVGLGSSSGAGSQTPPMDTFSRPYFMEQIVPRSGTLTRTLEYDVVVGDNSELRIEMVNEDDTTLRAYIVYLENDQGTFDFKGICYAPGAYTVNLGSASSDGITRTLKLEFFSLPDMDYPKRITKLGVTYLKWNIEVDYMSESWTSYQISSRLDQMVEHYRIYANSRPSYWIDDTLTYEEWTYPDDHFVYYHFQFDHFLDSDWEYSIWVDRLSSGFPWYIEAAGWHYTEWWVDYGIAISGYYKSSCYYTPWHEYGHHIGIAVVGGIPPQEIYCTMDHCVMSNETYWQTGIYCHYHWWLRTPW
ncbi:MAG: hypothetical protein ACFFER_07350 [Candidatus Thorarchaeota archaeon]